LQLAIWRLVDNHNRTCERFIGKMPKVVEERRMRKIDTISNAAYDDKIRGYVVNDCIEEL